jgi:hypothetical protein
VDPAIVITKQEPPQATTPATGPSTSAVPPANTLTSGPTTTIAAPTIPTVPTVKVDAPKTEAPKADSGVQAVVTNGDQPKVTAAATSPSTSDAAKTDAPKAEASKTGTTAITALASPVVKVEGSTATQNADKNSEIKNSSNDSKNEGEKNQNSNNYKDKDGRSCDNWKSPVTFGPNSDRKDCGKVNDEHHGDDNCGPAITGFNVNGCDDDCGFGPVGFGPFRRLRTPRRRWL